MSKSLKDYLQNPNKCLYCGKEILPKEGQLISNVKQKKFCDLTCANCYNRQLKINKEKDEYNKNPNKCLYCNKDILANANQQLYDTKQKKFCNQSCAASYNKNGTKYEQNSCLNCGSVIKHKNKYCNHQCQSEYKYKKYISEWKEGKQSGMSGELQISNHIRKYLFDKYNNQCCKCGWKEINPITGLVPLQVHHIDGNAKNNNEDNLELLCPNCHSLTPNHGGLNRGHGRKDRYKK